MSNLKVLKAIKQLRFAKKNIKTLGVIKHDVFFGYGLIASGKIDLVIDMLENKLLDKEPYDVQNHR